MPKDVVVPDVAQWYRKRGFTALVFDGFGIGASDGEPRNDVSRKELRLTLYKTTC